jgi:hypothetical protein
MSTTGFKGKRTRGRKSQKRLPKPLVLISCEGKKTEPEYINGLRKTKRINKQRIRVLGAKECGGTDPRTIVKCAKNSKKKIIKEERLEYDSVWCVFDRDDHHNAWEAMKEARDNGFKVAFSNPSFELWYLLHFQDQTAHIERWDVCKKLDLPECIQGYEKRMKDLFSNLEGRLPNAITRAQKLRKMHKNNYNKPTYNPSTSVDELVSFLLELK